MSTTRALAMQRATKTRGISEQPAGSNQDRRKDGIKAWQIKCGNGATYLVGAPWCGVRCWDLLHTAGVKHLTPRLASVAAIEDDARSHHDCFRGWVSGPPPKHDWNVVVYRGDLIILFGRGVHVGMIRELVYDKRGVFLYAITEEGNTSSGIRGSQDNGGTTAKRIRYPSEIYGVALVDYPNN